MTDVDVLDGRRAASAEGLLATFGDAGILAAADVRVAERLCALTGVDDNAVALAVALAVRAPRLGHVFVDLATIATTAVAETDVGVVVEDLPWPDAAAWASAVAAAPVVAADPAPLRLDGTRLYLDRYWREERQVAEELTRLVACAPAEVDDAALRDGLARLFPDPGSERQVLAAATAVLQGVSVIAGGPGTGKTTTVARTLALLLEQATAQGRPAPLIGLAAPTARAASRLQEAVEAAAGEIDVPDTVGERLRTLEGVTLHRLLGYRPGHRSRFRHDRRNRLVHDVVVVDETSMVSLELMARLLEAVRAGARLVFVGDPGQLASVEAGAVLGDVVGPATDGLQLTEAARTRLASVLPVAQAPAMPAATGPLADAVVLLDRVHRYGEEIGAVAEAIRAGDADGVVAALRGGAPAVAWVDDDATAAVAANAIRPVVVDAAREAAVCAAAGDAVGALLALSDSRVLCAHRRGSYGVATWALTVERWLVDELGDVVSGAGRWYPGRPVLVTQNDPELRLYNGDVGVAVAVGEHLRVAFPRGGDVLMVSPARLEFHVSLRAMTIHKSQGSQVGTAVVVLPDESSRILTRELLYTAVTRAQDHLLLVGPETTIRAAVQRPVARASGLRELLWEVVD